ncbi:MAG: tetratricopeptide repeat protein [Bacteroides sp.]|nr:tetratricopeptide repeat protein [Bacteroides sp.]
MEYNERAAKTPLPGVELNIRSAGATASGADGRFALDFPTLHAGDRVTVRSVAKAGYEIFNKEAVEQWNINPSRPFTLVMCRTDRFRRLRDLYMSNSSASYRAQYARERAAIESLRSEGKLRDEEYRRRLTEIQENFDRQLDNLDNYVDHFARIDLSELSPQEQDIIDLVQGGHFDRAISRYDSMRLVTRYCEGIVRQSRLARAIDRLAAERDSTADANAAILAAITRQTETLVLAGGLDNNRRAASILAEVADADTLNIDWQLRTGLHFQQYLADYPAALRYFDRALRISIATHGKDHQLTAWAYGNIGQLFCSCGNYVKALQYCSQALRIQESIHGIEHLDVAISYNNIGSVLDAQGNYSKALNYYIKASEIQERILDDDHIEIATTYNNIGLVYSKLGNHSKALDCHTKAINIQERLLGTNHNDVAASYNNIGLAYFNQNDYTKALEYQVKALKIVERRLGANHPTVASSYRNLGMVWAAQGEYTKAINQWNKALEIYAENPGLNSRNYLDVLPYMYMGYMMAIKERGTLSAEFEDFMADKVVTATSPGKDTPAAAQGLHGEYYLLEFNDWNVGATASIYDVNEQYRGRPKDIAVMRDDNISAHHFDDQIGIAISLKYVGREEKSRIMDAYNKWKKSR